jgi:hypothetical protein
MSFGNIWKQSALRREKLWSMSKCRFRIDKPLLYSAFIVRKLIEEGAVTDRLKSAWLEVRQHASTRDARPVFLEAMLGELSIEDHFDLTRQTSLRISYSDIASEIIHSDGLVWITNEDIPSALMVFSYRNALNRLIVIELNQFTALLEAVIADRPRRWWIVKNLETGRISQHAE